MPGAREILQFVLTADATSAIKGFESVEASAEKSLGAAESRMASFASKATKIGAGGLVVSGLALLGLDKLANLSSDATVQLDKLKVAAEHSTQNIDVGALQAFNKELAKSTDIRAQDMFGGQALMTNLGLTTTQIKQLTPLVGDLSDRFGLSFEQATKLTVRAIAGSSQAFKRYGIIMEDTDGVAGGFTDTLNTLNDSVGGFSEAKGKTFEGSVQRMRNSLKDLGADVGTGVTSALTTAADAIGGFAAHLDAVSPGVLAFGGQVATWGAIGLAATSAVSLIVGQVAKLTPALTDAEGAMTTFGVAASGLGVALAGVAVYQGLTAGINASNDVLGKTSSALDDIKIAAAKANPDVGQIGKSFADIAQAGAKTVHLSSLWEEFGTSIQVSMSKAAQGGKDTNQAFLDQQVTIEDAQRALDKLSPKQALLALDALQKTTNAITDNSDQRKANQKFIDDNRTAIEKHAKASKADADAQDAATGSTKASSAATKQLTSDIKAMQTPLDQWAASLDVLAAGGKAAAQAIDFSTNTDEQISNASKMGKAVDDFKTNVKALPGSIDQAKLALGGYSDTQQKAIDSLSALASENQDYVSGLIASGSSSEDVKAKAAALNDEYGRQLRAAGLNTAQVAEYQRVLGLTPPQVNTAITLSGEAEAKAELQILSGSLASLDENSQQQIAVKVAAGDSVAALQLLLIDQAKLAAGFQSPMVAKIEAEAETASAHGDLDKEANLLRVAHLYAQADVTEANGDLDAAAAQRRTADILAAALGIPNADAALDQVADPRQAPVNAHANTKAAAGDLDTLTAPRTVEITPNIGKVAVQQAAANFAKQVQDALGGLGKSAPPAAPPAVAAPHVGAQATTIPAAPSYVDNRRITINTTNPPGTVDTLKGIKRALKINGDELRSVLLA